MVDFFKKSKKRQQEDRIKQLEEEVGLILEGFAELTNKMQEMQTTIDNLIDEKTNHKTPQQLFNEYIYGEEGEQR